MNDLQFLDAGLVHNGVQSDKVSAFLKSLDRKCCQDARTRRIFERDRALDTTRLVRLLAANAGSAKGAIIEQERRDAGLNELVHRAAQSYLMQKTRGVPTDQTYDAVRTAMKTPAHVMAQALPSIYQPALLSTRTLQSLLLEDHRAPKRTSLSSTLFHMAHIFHSEPVVIDGLKDCVFAVKDLRIALGDAEGDVGMLRAAIARCRESIRDTFSQETDSHVMHALHQLYTDQFNQSVGMKTRSVKLMLDLDSYLVYQLSVIRDHLFELDRAHDELTSASAPRITRHLLTKII